MSGYLTVLFLLFYSKGYYMLSPGLENIDRYNFTTLLEFSKRSDLSDIKNTFTPDADDIYSLGILPQEFITSCSFDKKACSFR